jgi:hypothetical protein
LAVAAAAVCEKVWDAIPFAKALGLVSLALLVTAVDFL